MTVDVARPHVETVLSYREALARVLEAACPTEPVMVRLGKSLNRVLAEAVVADAPSPPFDQSSLDGYAVRADDLRGAAPARPVELEVIDEVAAGAVTRLPLAAGRAIRIMTGAAIPPGADAVVPVEQTTEDDAATVTVLAAVQAGDGLRRTGEDIRPGMRLLECGMRLTPARIGLLALTGRAAVAIRRPPTVAILATGDELAGNGVRLAAGKIRNVNSPMLAAMAHDLGCEARDLGQAGDVVDAISALLDRGLQADVVITSGGVSAGRYDYVVDALRRCGVTLLVHGVNIKPGKPLTIGRRGRTLCFALPGNPVSAFVTFAQFVRPAMLKIMGQDPDAARTTIPAVLAHAITKSDRKRHFHRVVVERRDGRYTARSSGGQGSHMLASLARANGFVVIPEESDGCPAGQTVEVELL